MSEIRKNQEQLIFNAIKAVSDQKTAEQIIYGEDRHATAEDDPTWVVSTMRRLETHFDKATVQKIRMNCQCGHRMEERLALLKELIQKSSSLKEFANQEQAKASGISYVDGGLYLQFSACTCPMLAEVERLESDTWCQCTAGYSKLLFEKTFGCDVEIKLLKSIKMGDDICLMKINFRDLNMER